MTIRAEPGAQLGPYRLISSLGTGGMGEVWRARDAELGRDVAIKLLPPTWARDPDRLARFEIEARAVAQLNHPNVLTVHGVGREDGSPYLITELLEGRTLRDLIAEGALSLRKALDYGIQIAEGLAGAHEKGIVHRDLKPANIFVVTDGRVKILDFGLAKFTQAFQISNYRLETATGVLLGTPGYMAPEQVSGEPADARADIFAFGAILFEMVTGRRAFAGESAGDAIKAILMLEPSSPSNVPLPVDRIIRRCLEKNRSARFQSASDLAFHLRAISETLDARTVPPVGESSPAIGVSLRWIPWILAAGALAMAAWVATTSGDRASNSADTRLRRYSIVMAEPLAVGEQPPLALSPDGNRVAYLVAGVAPQIWIRDLSELTARPLRGTEGAFAPFFSPDGQSLGFFTNNAMMRVPLGGGPPTRVADLPPVTRGAVWTADDWIYFTPSPSSGIARIRAGGGTIEPVTFNEAEQRSEGHVWPDVSPDGRFLLFVARRGDSFEDSHLMVRRLTTGESRVISKGGTYARFASGDRVVFDRGGTLFVARFDPDALALAESPQLFLDAVQTDLVSGNGWYALARDGTLAYVPGDARPAGRTLLWVMPSGNEVPAFPTDRAFLMPAVSPDGRSVVVTIDGMHQDLWRFDLGSSILTRLTTSPGEDFGPVWSPDGLRLAYASILQGRAPVVFVKPSDRSDQGTPFFAHGSAVFPNAWTADQGLLVSAEQFEGGKRHVVLLSLDSSSKPRATLAARYDRYGAVVSPTGKHVAFVSLETGSAEVFIAAMPDGASPRQISIGGGTSPVWSRDGQQLFYRCRDRMMAVNVAAQSGAITASPARLLFSGNFEENSRPDWPRNYDVAPDGRFLMVRQTYTPQRRIIVLVLGWRGGPIEAAR